MNETALVQKVWNYAHVLRDQGVPYQAYISQISYLLFLKMDEERAGLAAYGIENGSAIPEDCRWHVLRDLHGEELTRRYSAILDQLSRLSGIVGTIFLKAQNEIQDPAKLRRLVGLIDGETWLGLGIDVKGSIYEGLLERNAQEVKSGAGQYFTPRALIDAMVTVVDPEPRETVHDPACGTETNQRFTLKERPMTRADLDDFVACYDSGPRARRDRTLPAFCACRARHPRQD
jgi:type I restriction enzyme M protein